MKDYSMLILIYIIFGTVVPMIIGISAVYGKCGIPAVRLVFYLLLTVGSISLMVYYSTPMYQFKFWVFILLVINCKINAWMSSGSLTINALVRKMMIVLMIIFFVMGAIFNYHPLMGFVYHFLDKL